MDTRLGGLTKEIRVTRTAPRPRSSSTSRRRPWLSDLSPSRSREYSWKYTRGSLLHPCVLCINRSLWSAPGTRTDPGRPSRAAALARVDDRVVSVNEKAVVVSSVQGSGACVQRACDRAAPVTDSDGSPIKARTNQRIFSRCQCQPCSTRLIAAVELRRGGTRPPRGGRRRPIGQAEKQANVSNAPGGGWAHLADAEAACATVAVP
jgi:hypothetical protein